MKKRTIIILVIVLIVAAAGFVVYRKVQEAEPDIVNKLKQGYEANVPHDDTPPRHAPGRDGHLQAGGPVGGGARAGH